MDFQEVSVRYEQAETRYRHARPGTPDYERAKRDLADAGMALFLSASALGVPVKPIGGPEPA